MIGEIPRYSVKLLRFRSGERFPAVVDGRGLLATQPNIYALVSLRPREKSAAASEKRLRAVTLALNWASDRQIDLQARASTFEFLSPMEIQDLRDTLRSNLRAGKDRDAKATVGSDHYVNRCHAVRDYIVWHGEAALQRVRVGDPRLKEARQALDRFIKVMDADLPSGASREREGVPEEVLLRMLDVIVPGHPENPFQEQHQHRNYALLLLYYETGMRRGEALKLKVKDLINLHGNHPEVRVIRRPDDKDDTRGVEPRVKTLGRPIPISKDLARALLVWISKHRSDGNRYKGAKRVPYVFVSRAGRPLGLRTVNDMFDLLRKRVGLPPDLTTHANRYGANVRFSKGSKELGWSDAETALARNHHFGWVKGSEQGARYNKQHAKEMAAALVASVQRKSLGQPSS